ncbi:unnamed protein product, partial [marine sediment metagenome]
PKACFSMKNGDWEYFMGKEIYGKIIGVIGTGKI